MTTRAELEKLSDEAEAAGRSLTAEAVVEAAKDAKAFPELHTQLWAPSEAELAAEARLSRAHKMLISIRIITDEGSTSRMFVHTRSEPGYRPYEKVISSSDLAASKMRQLLQDIARARQRLASFKSLLDDTVAGELDDILARAERVAAPVERGAQAA